MGRMGLTPNVVSVIGMIFATCSFFTLWATSQQGSQLRRAYFLASALFIQLRLFCNLIDGMIAVELGKGTPLGELFNEIPDRISDILTLTGFGLAFSGNLVLGLFAAVSAVCVAYIRAFGASIIGLQAFHGPMAKPHRMFLVTIICLFCAFFPEGMIRIQNVTSRGIVALSLMVLIFGAIITMIRRIRFIAETMLRKNSDERN